MTKEKTSVANLTKTKKFSGIQIQGLHSYPIQNQVSIFWERSIDGDLILATKVRNLPSLKAEETEKGTQEGINKREKKNRDKGRRRRSRSWLNKVVSILNCHFVFRSFLCLTIDWTMSLILGFTLIQQLFGLIITQAVTQRNGKPSSPSHFPLSFMWLKIWEAFSFNHLINFVELMWNFFFHQ